MIDEALILRGLRLAIITVFVKEKDSGFIVIIGRIN
jgi:hypothetical protein